MNCNVIHIIEGTEFTQLLFGNSPALMHYIQKIPGAEFEEKTNSWFIHNNNSLFIKEFCDFAIKRKLATEVINISNITEVRNFAEHMQDLNMPYRLNVEPYPYQRKGIQYMITKKRTFNCDDMGLGKTFQSIAAIAIAKAYPCLVISPAAMKVTWQREFFRFIGKRAIILDNENKDSWHKLFETGACNIFITNYESIKKFFIRGSKGKRVTVKNLILDNRTNIFRSVIIDECHRCKEKSTLWSKYIECICKNKEYIFMLTGTPIVTSCKDLKQQLKIMGRLDDLGGEKRFTEKYCGNNVNPTLLSELNYLLWQNCYFRRDKSLVLKELPEKIRQYNIVELTNKEEYDKAEENVLSYLREYKRIKDDKLRTLSKGKAIVKIGVLRRLSAEGKTKEAIAFIQNILDLNQKIIVFCAHKKIVRILKRKFKGSVTVTGSDDTNKKQLAVDKFQNDENCKVIILNIKSGGVGITLTSSSNVLFVEFPWTAADCDQCECRSHRNGQKNIVNCTYLLGKNTFDEIMYDTINEERTKSAVVTGAKDETEEKIIEKAFEYFKI